MSPNVNPCLITMLRSALKVAFFCCLLEKCVNAIIFLIVVFNILPPQNKKGEVIVAEGEESKVRSCSSGSLYLKL